MNRSSARQYLDQTKNLVFMIFGHRCIICSKPTTIVHEIIPISHGREFLAVKNRVPICNKHHTEAHQSMKKFTPFLLKKREEFLRKKWQMKKDLQ